MTQETKFLKTYQFFPHEQVNSIRDIIDFNFYVENG